MGVEVPKPMSDATMRRAFWRTATASRAAVIVDADDYFRAARSAMLKAKRRAQRKIAALEKICDCHEVANSSGLLRGLLCSKHVRA